MFDFFKGFLFDNVILQIQKRNKSSEKQDINPITKYFHLLNEKMAFPIQNKQIEIRIRISE